MSDKRKDAPMQPYTVVMVNKAPPHEVKTAKVNTTHADAAGWYAYRAVGPLQGNWRTITLEGHAEVVEDNELSIAISPYPATT